MVVSRTRKILLCLGLAAFAVGPSAFGVEVWRPKERWCGFNLLGMFCQTKMAQGDKRVFGHFPEDRFQWMREWGFNFARLPLDYRFFVESGDWMKPVESQLAKLDEAVRFGKRYGIHVQINFHRAPGYCCNPPYEPKSLFRDPEPLAAFTNLWSVIARRYRGVPNEELSFDLVNEPAPVGSYGATPSNYSVVARAALAAIRAVDADRFVMSDGWRWGNEPVMDLHPFDSASGESIHCYAPHDLTHFRVGNPKEKGPCPPWPPKGWTNGVEWLERNYVKGWRPAIDDGTFLFVGELGAHQGTVPHATWLAWLEDALTLCDRHGWGWALWNLDGMFGILDTPRTDCAFEDFRGHKLDRAALDILLRHRERASDVPFNALRFGSRYTQPDKWPEMRAALEKNRAAFDEVWFSTGVSFPPLAWHEEHARQCAVAARDLRRLGIVPSIEIQTVIGHTDAILDAGDCTGQDWGTMVSADGLAAKRLSCPRDPKLIAYFARVAELHAAWKPGSVWVDDDLSYRNRAPVLKPENNLPGCFCDRCLAGFAKVEGRVWARDELAKTIRSDPAVRARWDDYSCAGMGELTRAIAVAVRRVSPETVMGYQYGGGIRPAIPRGLFEGSGRPVRLRPGAGSYWDGEGGHGQLWKAFLLQDMLRDVRNEPWVGACCPEIETCPRTFACRTPQGLILEAFENLALGMDFLSMFAADARTDESTAFYADRLFPRLAAAHPFLKGYRDANAGTAPCGLSVVNGVPAGLVDSRGVPIAPPTGRSLGRMPDVSSIKVRMSGSGEVDVRSPKYQTRVMQIVSSTGLTNFYARCDQASGERLPVVFDDPVMLFVMPRVRADGTLATLAVVNASIDRQDPVVVRLRGVPVEAKTAVWQQPEAEPVEIGIGRRGTDCRVRLPRIGAWECGYLDFK